MADRARFKVTLYPSIDGTGKWVCAIAVEDERGDRAFWGGVEPRHDGRYQAITDALEWAYNMYEASVLKNGLRIAGEGEQL